MGLRTGPDLDIPARLTHDPLIPYLPEVPRALVDPCVGTIGTWLRVGAVKKFAGIVGNVAGEQVDLEVLLCDGKDP